MLVFIFQVRALTLPDPWLLVILEKSMSAPLNRHITLISAGPWNLYLHQYQCFFHFRSSDIDFDQPLISKYQCKIFYSQAFIDFFPLQSKSTFRNVNVKSFSRVPALTFPAPNQINIPESQCQVLFSRSRIDFSRSGHIDNSDSQWSFPFYGLSIDPMWHATCFGAPCPKLLVFHLFRDAVS